MGYVSILVISGLGIDIFLYSLDFTVQDFASPIVIQGLRGRHLSKKHFFSGIYVLYAFRKYAINSLKAEFGSFPSNIGQVVVQIRAFKWFFSLLRDWRLMDLENLWFGFEEEESLWLGLYCKTMGKWSLISRTIAAELEWLGSKLVKILSISDADESVILVGLVIAGNSPWDIITFRKSEAEWSLRRFRRFTFQSPRT